jgi:flagellar biogenesis protein FliO
MPTFAHWISFAIILLAAHPAWSQVDNRYDQFRHERAQPAPGEDIAPQTEDELSSVEPAEDDNAWQKPPRALRESPFRREPASPDFDRSKVIRAAANEVEPKSLSKPSDARPLALKSHTTEPTGKRGRPAMPSAATLFGSLAIVVGLFLIVAWAARRGMPKQPPLLPREALEVLGRQRFGGKHEVQLVRVGNKLVLIHIVPGHAEALVEITDPEEVDRLTGICYQTHPYSSSRGFQQTLQQVSKERPLSRRSSRHDVDKPDFSMFDNLSRSSTKTT